MGILLLLNEKLILLVKVESLHSHFSVSKRLCDGIIFAPGCIVAPMTPTSIMVVTTTATTRSSLVHGVLETKVRLR